MTESNFKDIESKWQKEWEKAGLGLAEIDKNKKKFYIIWAYATVSGFQHTGHMRGFSYTDAICRYKRMNGFNVLLTAGGHATGNGAIAKAQKIKQKDPVWLNEFASRGLSVEEIEKISDPLSFVKYFADTYIQDYKQFGFLGDWRRFIITTNQDYMQFINWQFHKLQELGLLIQKPYFATACIKDGPVAVDPSEMDLSKGGNAEVNEYTTIKMQYQDSNQFILCATLRPDTMFGQTNIWLDPKINYVKVGCNNEIWIVSKQAAEKLSYQKDNLQIIGEISGNEMIGKFCHAPLVEKDILILPSNFCNPNIGTGIVTSVPSDSPHDWMGLYDLQNSKEECEKHGLNFDQIKSIKPISIMNMPGFGDFPALELCKKYNIKNQTDPNLEEAKKEIYKIGFHSGVLKDSCGIYSGLKASVAKETMKQDLINLNKADILQDLSEEVICRCGEQVVIRKVEGQWFIKYSDSKLTEESKKHALSMNIMPQNYRDNIEQALDWFQDRPCARQGRWLGTSFPFDKSYIIEAISDSTIYPIYYLVSKYVNEGKINPDNLTLKFFDYIFLGRGDLKEVSNECGVEDILLSSIKSDIEYWYPLDINLGGKEHRRVHFPPFIMNHVAILPKQFWPKGIFVNEWVMKGKNQKLSKSKGGAQPISDVSSLYGVDSMRLYYANIGSPFMDIYFSDEDILNYRQRLEKIYSIYADFVENLPTQKLDDLTVNMAHNSFGSTADSILISKLNRRILQATNSMDEFDFKKTTDVVYMDLVKDIQSYKKMGGNNVVAIIKTLASLAKMMTPFTPHVAEECWMMLREKMNESVQKTFFLDDSLVSVASWPQFDESKIDEKAENTEELLQNVLYDIREVQKLAKLNKIGNVTLIISLKWKYEFYLFMKEMLEKTKDFKEIMNEAMKHEEFKRSSGEITKLIPNLIKKGLPELLINQEEERKSILDQLIRIEKEFNCQVKLFLAEESQDAKAKNASPGKPAIVLS